MTNAEKAFLLAVVGDEGTRTLLKAIEVAPVLDAVLVPRVILSWLQSASSFEGAVPGAHEAYARFEKREYGISGEIVIEGNSYAFEGESIFSAAAGIAASLGLSSIEVPEDIRAIDLDRAGRTIDLLVKARRVSSELQKAADDDDRLSDEDYGKKYGEEKLKARKAKKVQSPLDKAIGDSAPPVAPTAAKPQKTAAPKVSTAAPKVVAPKATSTSTMSLTRSEASSPCLACGGHQFVENTFVGCICFEAIAKSIKVVSATDSGLVLELDRRMLEQDDVDALTDAFKATGVIDGQ